MNVFAFHSVEIDPPALRAFVLVGRWPDVVSGKPSGTRSLAIELGSVDESTPVYASELAMGFDWSQTRDGAEYLVIDGALAEKPTQPSPHHVFNYTTKQWEDPRTLADLKAAKNQAINLARAAANQSWFVFQGKRIAVDALSRSDIDAAHGSILMLQALPPGWPGGWKSMDNEICQIPDVATWGQFYGTMVAAGTANFNHAQTLKAQLAAASTPAEVEAVPNW